jgi:DNA invertase Pin-like site-specific DNA recombinase
MLFGYARESATGTPLDEQIAQLQKAGCETVFKEPWTSRDELAKALHAVQFGDVLTVTSLDRLAWSIREVLDVVEKLRERGAGLRSLTDPWADPTTDEGRHVLTFLHGMARFERTVFTDRLKSFQAQAAARGTKMGRRRALLPGQIEEARSLYNQGMFLKDVAKKFGVSEATMSRHLNPPRPRA